MFVIRVVKMLPRLWRLTRRVVLWNQFGVLEDPEAAEMSTPDFSQEFESIKKYVFGEALNGSSAG